MRWQWLLILMMIVLLKKARAGRLWLSLKHKLGAVAPSAELDVKIYGAEFGARIYGAKLGARVTGAELPAMSPLRWRRAKGPDSKIFPPGVYL